jgi:hypothetical protein
MVVWPMVYSGRLLIGYHFEVLLKVLRRDHVDRGNELAVVVVGPIGTYWPCAWLYIDCAQAWGEGGIPVCPLARFRRSTRFPRVRATKLHYREHAGDKRA